MLLGLKTKAQALFTELRAVPRSVTDRMAHKTSSNPAMRMLAGMTLVRTIEIIQVPDLMPAKLWVERDLTDRMRP